MKRRTHSLIALGLMAMGVMFSAPGNASAFWWRHVGPFACGGPPLFCGGCCIGPPPPMYFYNPCPICYGGNWALPCYPCCYGAPGGQLPPYSPMQQPGTPATTPDSTPSSAPATPAKPTSMTTAGVLELDVPAEARVFVNDLATRTTGTHRRFVSPGLTPGLTYTYHVRVELPANPQPIVETKTVKLHAGDEQLLAFHMTAESQNTVAQYTAEQKTAQQNSPANSAPLSTSLTLHVPADAQVFLGGNPTTTTGTTRTYQTVLPPGERLSGYTVRVRIERDGKVLSREQTITLAAGERRELNFDFTAGSAPSLAVSK